MQRRTFLKRGLFGGAVLAAGGGLGLGLFPTRTTFVPRGELRVLDAREFAILAAAAARFVTVEGVDPISVAQTIDHDILPVEPEELRQELKQGLLAFDSALVGFVLDGRPSPFTALAPADQDAAIEAWRDSRLVFRRTLYRALREMCLSAYYRTPACWEGVGYPGPPEIAS